MIARVVEILCHFWTFKHPNSFELSHLVNIYHSVSVDIGLHCVVVFARFETDQYDKVPFFMFGDFNFRLDTNQLVKVRSHLFMFLCC